MRKWCLVVLVVVLVLDLTWRWCSIGEIEDEHDSPGAGVPPMSGAILAANARV